MRATTTKKLIYYGWGTRDTRYVRDNWRMMEEMPFDGIGISVAVNRDKPSDGDGSAPNLLRWNVFGPRKFQRDQFQPAIADLKAAQWKKFTDNFLVACIATPGQDYDWFDDDRWKTCVHNWKLLVTIAKEGGCKGIILDPEHYRTHFFIWQKLRTAADKPFAEYAQKASQRGRELMSGAAEIYPDITIFELFGHTLVWNYVTDAARTKQLKPVEEAEYGLYAAFLDGMLQGASPRTKFVDAYEFAYAFKDRRKFEDAYSTIRRQAVQISGVPDHYAQHVQAGFGLWLDYGGAKDWNPAKSGKNHFSPSEWEQALKSALEVSDEYVWVYSHSPRFFPREKLPDEYLRAIEKARSSP